MPAQSQEHLPINFDEANKLTGAITIGSLGLSAICFAFGNEEDAVSCAITAITAGSINVGFRTIGSIQRRVIRLRSLVQDQNSVN